MPKSHVTPRAGVNAQVMVPPDASTGFCSAVTNERNIVLPYRISVPGDNGLFFHPPPLAHDAAGCASERGGRSAGGCLDSRMLQAAVGLVRLLGVGPRAPGANRRAVAPGDRPSLLPTPDAVPSRTHGVPQRRAEGDGADADGDYGHR